MRVTSRPERNAWNEKKREIQADTTTIRFCYLIAGALIRQASRERCSDLLTIAEREEGTVLERRVWSWLLATRKVA